MVAVTSLLVASSSGLWNGFSARYAGLTGRYLTPSGRNATAFLPVSPLEQLHMLIRPNASTNVTIRPYTPPTHTYSVPVIPTTSFDSYSDLEASWNYGFPAGFGASNSWPSVGVFHWGASAIMVGNSTNHTHVNITTPGQLDLISTPLPVGQIVPDWLHYLSGTIYSAMNISLLQGDVGFDLGGRFNADTNVGSWPAFWLVDFADSWSAEIDVLEWNGNGGVSYNVYNQNGWTAFQHAWIPGWHDVRCEIRNLNNVNTSITWYQDNILVGTKIGINHVGSTWNLQMDYQMEGNSGTPGPNYTTTFSAQSVYVNYIYANATQPTIASVQNVTTTQLNATTTLLNSTTTLLNSSTTLLKPVTTSRASTTTIRTPTTTVRPSTSTVKKVAVTTTAAVKNVGAVPKVVKLAPPVKQIVAPTHRSVKKSAKNRKVVKRWD